MTQVGNWTWLTAITADFQTLLYTVCQREMGVFAILTTNLNVWDQLQRLFMKGKEVAQLLHSNNINS